MPVESSFWLFVVYIICAVVLVALGLLHFRTGTHVTQFKQGFFRFMVGQETNLRTRTWEQVDTAHFRIKYLPIDKYSVGL